VIFIAVVTPTALMAQTPETIEFPDEELAAESVLPIFDLNLSVRNRAIALSRRIELGVGMGYSLLEPFFNPLSLAGNMTYQWNEEQGINLMASFSLPGTSSYTNQLNPIPTTGTNANLQNAPATKYTILANYQYSAFYGKLSVSKDYIVRTSLYGLAGLGMIGIADSSNIAVTAGIGQRFFLTPQISIRLDLRGLLFQGPDILSRKLYSSTGPEPAASFGKKLNFNIFLGFGMAWLLPSI
jgi:outer membrane beta-barrel protein